MTEHKHATEGEKYSDASFGVKWSVPASIVLAGLLISGSILYSNNLLIKRLARTGTTTAGTQTAAGTGSGAQQFESKVVDIKIREDAPKIGSNKGDVTFVEFSDFQCPYCQRFVQEAYGQIKSKYADSGKIKFLFQHYPLPFHQNAQKAGEAAECANKLGKFSQYHDILFAKGKADGTGLNIADLKAYAQEAGLNASSFNQCLDSGEKADIVKADMQLGQSLGVSGTPSMLIMKNDDMTMDVGFIMNELQQNKSVITLPNGNIFIVGAQPLTVFEQSIEAVLKN